jgi:hypothetical protein
VVATRSGYPRLGSGEPGYRRRMALKSMLARKAVKTTAKHTAHGTAAKLKREPMRTTTLLGLGAAIGAATTWLLGRLGGSGPSPDSGTTG